MSEKDVVENVDSPGEIAIPYADNNTPGIASFDSKDFTVDPNGKVSSIVERGIPQYLGKITGTGTGTTDLNWEVDWKSRPTIVTNGEEEVDKAKRIKPGEYIMLTEHFNQFLPGDIFRITSVQIEGSKYTVKTNNVKALSLASIVGPQGERGNEGAQGVPYLAYTNNIESTIGPIVDALMYLEDGHFNRTPIIKQEEYQDVVTVDWYNKTTQQAFMVTGLIQNKDSATNKWVARITAATDITGAVGPQGKEGTGMADIESIDYPNGQFTYVGYDKTDGLQVSAIAKFKKNAGDEYDIPATVDIPLVTGDGLSMDVGEAATEDEDKIVVKSLNSNLENGEGEASIQQRYLKDDNDYSATATGENATAFGGKRYDKLTDANRTPTSAEGKQSFAAGGSSHAYGDYAIAMAKDNKSYQAASFTVGGGNQTGRTEAEFNDFYWDSVNNVGLHGGSKDANGNIIDAYGDTYADSCSFGGTFGEVNVNRGRDSIVGGINNKVDALQSIVAGDRNVSITGAKHIVAGFNNNVTDVNNTVNGDSNTVAGPNNVVGGYKNNVNGLANTINGANNTADGDYNLIEGQANITASRSSTIVGYKNAIGYTRDDNLSNAQKTKLEVRDEFVAGVGNTASHGNGGLIGCGLKTGKDEQVAVGVANEGKSNTVFEVGNGSYTQDDSGAIHITNRKNAFEVLDDGRAKVQTAPKENNDIVTLQYAKARFAALNDGTAIPDDADLNNYTTPGNYTYLGMNIKNAPPQQSLTKRFRMYVLAFNSDGAGAYRQIVISAENTIYWRSISDGFTTEWYKFTSGGEFITPSTATSDATSGTFTADEWSKLQANMNNKILFNNEIYRLNDPGHTPGIWSYVHTGWDGADIMDKSINVTVATGAWTLVTGQASGGGKLYLHKVNLTGTYLIDIYSSYSTTFTYESFVAYLNKIARDIPCYIWADDGRAKYQLTRVGYISSAGIYTGWYNGNEYNDVYTYSIESDTVTEL